MMKASDYKVGKVIDTKHGKAKVEGVHVGSTHVTVSYRYVKRLSNGSETGSLSFPK